MSSEIKQVLKGSAAEVDQRQLDIYRKLSFAERFHPRDIAAILKSKKNELDMNYIEQWAARLGLSSLWKEMLDNIS